MRITEWRRAVLFSLSVVIATTMLSLAAEAQIKNVVIIVKENHSFDNYFGLFPGANGASTGNSKTQTGIPLKAMRDNPVNCVHSWKNAHKDIDNGLMDGFYEECGNTYNAYVQAQPSLIPNYWAYAQTYGLADNFFSELAGPTFPNRMYVFAESSGNAIGQPLGVSNVIDYGLGCDAAAQGAYVNSINPDTDEEYTQPPCFDMQTMGDVLDTAAVTWRIYSPQPGKGAYQWNFGSYFSNLWHGADRVNDVPDTQFCTDAAAGQLPQVSWITPHGGDSEHPADSISNGESWTVEQINCVMNSSYWASSLILVTWDDWGGFYDHVPPPTESFFGYSMRVPLLVISPYAKPGHVGHVLYSFDSMNKEIEAIFDVPCLLTDCSSSVNDLSDMLTTTPAAPKLVLAPRPHIKQKSPHIIDGYVETDDDE
jgi:phospholipase C